MMLLGSINIICSLLTILYKELEGISVAEGLFVSEEISNVKKNGNLI